METAMDAYWYGLDLKGYTTEEISGWLKIQWKHMSFEVNRQNYYPVQIKKVQFKQFEEAEYGTDVAFKIIAECDEEIFEESPIHEFISECFRAELRFY